MKRHGGEPAHADDGSLTAAVEFDYEAIERNLFARRAAEEIDNQAVIDGAARLFQQFMRWVWQDGKKNPNGVQIRAMIACWIFIPELRPLKETDLAIGWGMKKQSIDRWVQEWKKDFPKVRSPHMRPL